MPGEIEAITQKYSSHDNGIYIRLDYFNQLLCKALGSNQKIVDGLRWIPAKLILADNLDNMLVKRLNSLKDFSQSKVDDVWEAAQAIYDQYGIQLDPPMMLSILAQEGTGSFNTSSTNRAADGQHGFEKDFALDVIKANSLMMGKLLGYIYHGSSMI